MSRDMMLTVDEYLALRRLIGSERESEGAQIAPSASAPKRRKTSAYNRRYKAAFKRVSPRYKLKNGNWRSGGFRKAVKAAHKEAKR